MLMFMLALVFKEQELVALRVRMTLLPVIMYCRVSFLVLADYPFSFLGTESV